MSAAQWHSLMAEWWLCYASSSYAHQQYFLEWWWCKKSFFSWVKGSNTSPKLLSYGCENNATGIMNKSHTNSGFLLNLEWESTQCSDEKCIFICIIYTYLKNTIFDLVCVKIIFILLIIIIIYLFYFLPTMIKPPSASFSDGNFFDSLRSPRKLNMMILCEKGKLQLPITNCYTQSFNMKLKDIEAKEAKTNCIKSLLTGGIEPLLDR